MQPQQPQQPAPPSNPSQPQPPPPAAPPAVAPAAPTPPQASPSIPNVAPPPVPQNEAPKAQPKKHDPNSSQNALLVSELRENMVIMNDGSFRVVVASKSINFDLMSEREREGVEYSYQGFINSLTFPIQVLIRSQRVDIAPYLDRLEGMRRSEENMLLGVMMDNYIDFIQSLAEEANIMDKSFFVVVPYYPAGDFNSAVSSSKNLFASMFKSSQPQNNIKIGQEVYDKAKEEIQNRVNGVLTSLFQIGIRSVQLNTKELGELYYNFFNPDTAVRQRLGNFEDVTNTYVQKGEGEATRPHLRGD